MIYLDGSTVKLDDLVWWDEGNSIGRIIDICETRQQCVNWGIEAPGVIICYDGSSIGGLFIGCPYHAFAEEGIQRLTSEEEAKVKGVLHVARSFSSGTRNDVTAGIFRKITEGQEYWNVVFYHNRQALRVIEVNAMSLSCREVPLKVSGLFYDLN